MNFLSTGEKIKRARIYKGITLKELCKKDISISKMSCIENDKIKPDKWVLEMVAERLDLNLDYLLYDDMMELQKSLATYNDKDEFNEVDFRSIKDSIEYCILKDYKALALNFIHLIFRAYTKNRRFEDIKDIIKIYNSFTCLSKEEEQLYYEDLSRYFLARRMYNDAITYFNRARNHIYNYTIADEMKNYVENNVYLAIAYYENGNYDEAKTILEEILHLEDKIINEEIIALINGLLVAVNMRRQEEYEKNMRIFENYPMKDSLEYCKVKLMIAEVYFENKNTHRAIEYINNIKDNIKNDSSCGYIELIIGIAKVLLDAKEIELAKVYCEEGLDKSIKIDNYFLIEKSYLYKARLDRANKNLIQWEMNMNVATDVLLKFSSTEEKRIRYIEMAEMYHIIGELRESLKYLTLAINLEKNIEI